MKGRTNETTNRQKGDSRGKEINENKSSVFQFDRFLSLLSYLIPFRFAHGRHERKRFVKVDFFALVALVSVFLSVSWRFVLTDWKD